MKLLMISEYYLPEGRGGGEISASLLAEKLSKDMEVHVLTSHFPGLEKEETSKGVIIHRRLKTGKNPGSLKGNLKRVLSFERSLLRELKLLQKEEGFDVIHCMNANSIAAVKLKHAIKRPFVLHVNGPVLFCPKGTLMYKDREICDRKCTRLTFLDCYLGSDNLGKVQLNLLTKFNPGLVYMIRKRYETYQRYLMRFDSYMAISGYMRERLLMAGIKRNNINVVYNIADFTKFLKLKLPKNKVLKILYLGEYSRPKGPHLIIEALKGLKGRYECGFYGSGMLEGWMKKESEKHNLNVKINDRANYGEIPRIMQKHDIVVVPSVVGEAFSRTVLEACAAGKTVIASDIGGIPDIIDSRTGLLFEAGNVEELHDLLQSAVMKDLSIDPKAVRKAVKQMFSPDEIKKQVIRIYKGLSY